MSSSRCRALFVSVSVLLAACGGDGGGGGGGGTGPDPTDAIASVTITPPTVSVNIGETKQLSAIVRNGRGESVSSSVTWVSTTPTVATVNSSGLVTGVGAGSTTIRASAGGRSGTASVTGVDPNPPDSPSGVAATALSDTEVEVTWTDNSANEAEFVIEREPVGAGSSSEEGASSLVYSEAGRVGANVTTFHDTGLSPGSGYRYRVEACNANGCSDKAGGSGGDDQTTTYETLVIETASLPGGIVGTAYSQALSASGGDGSVGWAVSAGSLPPGLSLSSEGTVSGSPTAPGTFDCTVQATGGGQVVTRDLAITIIAPPEVTTASLPNALTGRAYNEALGATGGDGTFSWQLTGGALPAGLSLASNGTISGTPTAVSSPSPGDGPTTVGVSAFTVQVASAGMTATADLAISVFDPLAVTTNALPDGILNTAYNQNLGATGGDGAYSWTVTAGSLPAGLALASNGTLSGTPTALGTSNFTVQVTSSDGQTASMALSIEVKEQILPPQVTTTSLPDGGVGAAYTATLQANEGDGSYTWAITAGALPAGLSLNAATGEISGTPTAAGTSNYTVQVTSAGLTGNTNLSITIHPPLQVTTAALPDGVEGSAYSSTIQATGGDGDNTFSLSAGSLPGGLALNPSTGEISGTPTAAPPAPVVDGPATVGTSNFTVQVGNGLGQLAAAALSLTINAVLQVTTASLPNGEVGAAYSQTLAASGGDGTNTWSVTSGDLPTGLALNPSTGAITGTPTAVGTSNFTVQVASGDGQADTQALSITVYTALSVTTSSLPDGGLGGAYSQSLTASGGDGSYTWSISVGTLPDGLSLNPSSGLISGTPTTAGTSNFTVQVASGDGQAATADLSLDIVASSLSVTTIDVDEARVGVSYNGLLEATGGTGSGYSWSLDSGPLPSGVTLSASGALTGTPLAVGNFPFTARVDDDGGGSATAALALYSCGAVLNLGVGESLVTPFPDRCGLVLPDADAGYRVALMARDQVYESGAVASLPGGLQVSAIAGTPGVEFLMPLQMPVMEVRSPLPGDEALDPEILELARATEQLSWRLREEEYHSRPNAPMTVPSVLGPSLAPMEPGPARDPPSTRQFFVEDAGQAREITIDATLRAFGANVEYYEDAGEVGIAGDLGVVTDGTQATAQEITDLLAYYDSYGKPVIDDAFGGLGPAGTTNNFLGGLRPADDIDQNEGRLIVLQIRESRMLDGAAAYVSACDRTPLPVNYNAGGYACPESNEAEMTYFSRPNSSFYLGALVHEVKHISSHGYALPGGRGFNPSWIEEGTAQIALGKSSRDAAGFADGTRVGLWDMYPGGSTTADTRGMADVTSRARTFLKASPLSALIGNPSPNPNASTIYGASWLFHRFLVDAYGVGGEDSFFLSLNTGGSGVAQVEAVTGQTIETLFAEFLVAIAVEGQASARAATTRRFTSYDFDGIADGWPSDGPWPYLQATSGFTTGTYSFATHYTSPNFFDYTTSGGTALRLDAFTSAGSDLSAGDDVVMVITRIR